MAKKLRLDQHLLRRNLVLSRQQAQLLIRAGKVRDENGKVLDKPGLLISEEIKIELKESPEFVSRGGQKLVHALKEFQIDVSGKVCLDAGISTGGFTDCLLQKGALKIYGIDVGYGQIAWTLRNDSRVILRERTNLRNLSPEILYNVDDIWPTFAVADLSFISLRLVLPQIRSLIKSENSQALLLVKPQFEVGRERVGKGGVVRDAKAHIDAINSVIMEASVLGWYPQGIVASPITGPAGNHEYLLWLNEKKSETVTDIENLVEQTLN